MQMWDWKMLPDSMFHNMGVFNLNLSLSTYSLVTRDQLNVLRENKMHAYKWASVKLGYF